MSDERGWRPIETAPKLRYDETVLGTDGHRVFAMEWMDDWYGDKSKACWIGANLDEEYGTPLEPTHWMPLPDPPTKPLNHRSE